MKITFLGSGTSQGVPVIACECDVCLSSDQRDKRYRSSVLIEIDGKNIVIDTGPDFRSQMLDNDVKRLDAVLFTHEHKDHIAGLDDVRPFNFKQQSTIPVFASEKVEEAIRREYHYIFATNKYPGVPEITVSKITNKEFYILDNILVKPIQVNHYLMKVFGYRINNFSYITDAKTIDNHEKNKLFGTEVLVVNALRLEEHISHFNLAEALSLIEEIKPQKAYLTHISHLFGKHSDIQETLPENVFIAFDGLQIEVK